MKISDLSTAKLAEQGAPLEVRHPSNGKKTDIVIYLRGMDSKEYRAKEREFRQRAMGKKIDDPIEAAEQQAMDARIACTVGWEGLEEDDGKPIKYTETTGREIYGDPGLRWLCDQVDSFIRDRANFLPPAPTKPSDT